MAQLHAACPAEMGSCEADGGCSAEATAALAGDGSPSPGSDLFNAVVMCMMNMEDCGSEKYACWVDSACNSVREMPTDTDAEKEAWQAAADGLSDASRAVLDAVGNCECSFDPCCGCHAGCPEGDGGCHEACDATTCMDDPMAGGGVHVAGFGVALAVVSGVGTREPVLAVGTSDLNSAGGIVMVKLNIEGMTTVSFDISDTAGNHAQCSSRYFIHDTQPPDLSCASLNVVGHTNPLRPYGTEEIGSLSIAYPSVSDNSGESLAALATVPGSHSLLIDYTPDYRFQYEGMEHDFVSHVSMTATDSSGNAASCTFEVRILDEEAPIIDCYGALRIDAATTDSGRLYGTTEDGLLDMVRRRRPFASLTLLTDHSLLGHRCVIRMSVTTRLKALMPLHGS